jgi:small-conductance mechanosensitive channel
MLEFITEWSKNEVVLRIARLALGVAVVWGLAAVVKRSIRRSVADTNARYQSNKVVGIASALIIITMLGLSVSGGLGGLALTVGAASAGVAFALQEVIASFAGWLAITFSNFYKPGDRVEVGGIRGDVIDVGILRTTVMEMGEWIGGDAYNGRIVRVANSFVFKAPVYNYSADFPWVWDEIKVPVRYGSDHERAHKLLLDLAAELSADDVAHATEAWPKVVTKYNIEPARVDPIVYMIGNDNWLEFTARYIVDPRMRRGRKDAYWRRLLTEVAKTDGGIQFASATYELVGAPALRVSLAGGRVAAEEKVS